jgi:hypothetical protein
MNGLSKFWVKINYKMNLEHKKLKPNSSGFACR